MILALYIMIVTAAILVVLADAFILWVIVAGIGNTIMAHGKEIAEMKARVKELEAVLRRIGYVVKKDHETNH